MRVLMCGDRNWTDNLPIDTVLESLAANYLDAVVIHGAARGADSLAGVEALVYGLQVEAYPAKWDEHGRAAGPIRNQQMLDEGKPHGVWAFHDNIANSKGTGDMVRRAKKAGIPVYVVAHG